MAKKKATPKQRAKRRKPSPRDHALLVVLAHDNSTLERVVTVLIDLGVPTTVIESKPLSTVLRNELPIFSSLASLLPPSPDGRLLLSVTTASLADRAIRLLSSEGRNEGAAERNRPRILASISLRGLVTQP